MCLFITRLLSDLKEYSQETYIKKTQDVETRSKQTKGMLTHRRWVRSGTERIEQGNQTDIIYNFNMLIHTTTHEFKLVASILV